MLLLAEYCVGGARDAVDRQSVQLVRAHAGGLYVRHPLVGAAQTVLPAAERATQLARWVVPTRTVAGSCGALSVTQVTMIIKVHASVLVLHRVDESASVLA